MSQENINKEVERQIMVRGNVNISLQSVKYPPTNHGFHLVMNKYGCCFVMWYDPVCVTWLHDYRDTRQQDIKYHPVWWMDLPIKPES